MTGLFKLIALFTAIAGSIALVGAWIAGRGLFAGLTQNRLYIDATNLLLASIAFGVLSLSQKGKKK